MTCDDCISLTVEHNYPHEPDWRACNVMENQTLSDKDFEHMNEIFSDGGEAADCPYFKENRDA